MLFESQLGSIIWPYYFLSSPNMSVSIVFAHTNGLIESILYKPMDSFADAVATCCSYLCVPLVQMLAYMHSILGAS
jgi:hypothetical protein